MSDWLPRGGLIGKPRPMRMQRDPFQGGERTMNSLYISLTEKERELLYRLVRDVPRPSLRAEVDLDFLTAKLKASLPLDSQLESHPETA